MTYELLLIDLDDTLLDFETDARRALAKTWKELSFPESDRLYERYERYNSPLWKQLESGTMTIGDIQQVRFQGILAELSLAGDPAEINSLYIRNLAKEAALFEGVHETLAELTRRYTLVLASNGIASVQEGRLRVSGLNAHFAHSILSEEVGASKPSAEFFRRGLRRFVHVPKEKILMIGDSLASDIRGAANMDYDACWINRTKKERPEGLPVHYEAAAFREVLRFL